MFNWSSKSYNRFTFLIITIKILTRLIFLMRRPPLKFSIDMFKAHTIFLIFLLELLFFVSLLQTRKENDFFSSFNCLFNDHQQTQTEDAFFSP